MLRAQPTVDGAHLPAPQTLPRPQTSPLPAAVNLHPPLTQVSAVQGLLSSQFELTKHEGLQFGTTLCEHAPLVLSQLSVVHGLPSLQLRVSALLQVPPEQLS